MSEACYKDYALHIEPNLVCFAGPVTIAGVANVAQAVYGSSPLVVNSAYTYDGDGAVSHIDLDTDTLLLVSAVIGVPNAIATGIAFCPVNQCLYEPYYEAFFAFPTGWVKRDSDTLVELLTISSGITGTITCPIYEASTNRIYALHDNGVDYVDCVLDTSTVGPAFTVSPLDFATGVTLRATVDRLYVPVNRPALPAQTRIVVLSGTTLAVTGTLGAGSFTDYEFAGIVLCTSNDRLYIEVEKTSDGNSYVLCVHPDTGAILDEIGPLAGTSFIPQVSRCFYDPADDLVYVGIDSIYAINPDDNTVACTYGPYANETDLVGVGGGKLFVPQYIAGTLITLT